MLDVISPALGFLFCLAIFLGLQSSTLVAGAIWLVVGGVYLLLKARGMSTQAIVRHVASVNVALAALAFAAAALPKLAAVGLAAAVTIVIPVAVL